MRKTWLNAILVGSFVLTLSLCGTEALGSTEGRWQSYTPVEGQGEEWHFCIFDLARKTLDESVWRRLELGDTVSWRVYWRNAFAPNVDFGSNYYLEARDPVTLRTYEIWFRATWKKRSGKCAFAPYSAYRQGGIQFHVRDQAGQRPVVMALYCQGLSEWQRAQISPR